MIGNTGEPRGYPADKSRSQPKMEPERPFGNDWCGIRARMSGARDPDTVQLRDEAMEQVEEGWLKGRAPYEPDGQLLTGEGPVKVNPAFRIGAHQEGKSRAVNDL